MDKETIIPIVEEYLVAKKRKEFQANSYYIDKLLKFGFSKEKAKDVFLKMDDEWTQESLAMLKLKNLRLTMAFGYSIGFLAIIVSIFSFFGIILNGQFKIFFYGAIASGLVTGIMSQGNISKIKHELSLRKYKWKNWI